MSQEPDLIIRASSFGGLFDCAARWAAIHLEKLEAPSSPRALIGSGVHAGTAAFDQSRVDGSQIKVDHAIEEALDEIERRIDQEPVWWTADEPNRKEVERIATTLTHTYCREISPRYEFEAVELTCTPLDIESHGVVIRLTGHLDRARVIATETARGIRRRLGDLKTGKAAVDRNGRAVTKKHRAQLGTYELLYEHTTGNTLDPTSEILGINTSGDMRFGTGEVTGCRNMLLGGPGEPGMIETAARMHREKFFPANPQSALCGAKYCPLHRLRRCRFADYSEE